jgi:uncharacterized protein YegJ (DUF2314 family)
MAENDILWAAGDDPEMLKAYSSAQRTFLEFARQAEMERFRVVPAFENVSVKAFFPVNKNDSDGMQASRGEHMYVQDVQTDGKTVYGILNGDPSEIRWLKDGDRVSFPISRLSDWMLVPFEKGTAMGGFTVDVLKSRMSPDELKEYEKYPPLKWYKHRVGTTAQDDLKQLPVCPTCNKRNLVGKPNQEGVCGLCANGLERCECTSCGAPIIRPPQQSRVCQRCLNPKGNGSALTSSVNAMTFLSKIYTGLVIVILALVLMSLGFMIFDPAGGQANGRLMSLGITSLLALVLAGTVAWNIRERKLVVVSTVLQIITLVLTCIGIPVALLGIVAMILERRNT